MKSWYNGFHMMIFPPMYNNTSRLTKMIFIVVLLTHSQVNNVNAIVLTIRPSIHLLITKAKRTDCHLHRQMLPICKTDNGNLKKKTYEGEKVSIAIFKATSILSHVSVKVQLEPCRRLVTSLYIRQSVTGKIARKCTISS